VNLTVRHWRPSAVRIGVLSAAIVAAPLMATAGEISATAAKPGPSIRTSVEKVVATQTLKSSGSATRAQQGGTTTDLGSRSFFRTPGGIIALVALAAGVGYTLYSTSNDRVKSPAK
jgi:hypothetical protein